MYYVLELLIVRYPGTPNWPFRQAKLDVTGCMIQYYIYTKDQWVRTSGKEYESGHGGIKSRMFTHSRCTSKPLHKIIHCKWY